MEKVRLNSNLKEKESINSLINYLCVKKILFSLFNFFDIKIQSKDFFQKEIGKKRK